MALAHPERIEALIVQDAGSRITKAWARIGKTRRAFWVDRAANESAPSHQSPFASDNKDATRSGTIPNVERNDPDLWTDEFLLFESARPGRKFKAICSTIIERTSMPIRNGRHGCKKTQPRLLVIWGKYDLSFDPGEPQRYRQDVPKAEVHVLDAGHFRARHRCRISELRSSFVTS